MRTPFYREQALEGIAREVITAYHEPESLGKHSLFVNTISTH